MLLPHRSSIRLCGFSTAEQWLRPGAVSERVDRGIDDANHRLKLGLGGHQIRVVGLPEDAGARQADVVPTRAQLRRLQPLAPVHDAMSGICEQS